MVVGGIGSWVQLGFKDNRVAITSYTWYCYPQDFLYKWTILGSDDADSWETIDDGELTEKPSGEERIALVFNVKKVLTKKYIRFVSHSKRFADDEMFVLHRIELFGVFFSSKKLRCTCKSRVSFVSNFIVAYFLMLK